VRQDVEVTTAADNQFDFVDTALMAVAERLQIADVYTFDERDFRVFRPNHRPYLRLFP
jgi:predicted nucleic acid-binding protein